MKWGISLSFQWKQLFRKNLKVGMIQGARCINKSSTFYHQVVRRVLIFSLKISTIPTSCTVARFPFSLKVRTYCINWRYVWLLVRLICRGLVFSLSTDEEKRSLVLTKRAINLFGKKKIKEQLSFSDEK